MTTVTCDNGHEIVIHFTGAGLNEFIAWRKGNPDETYSAKGSSLECVNLDGYLVPDLTYIAKLADENLPQ